MRWVSKGWMLVLGLVACDCSSTPSPTRPCETAADCASGEICVDGACQPRADGGPSDGGGLDGSRPDGGPPPCRTNDECEGAEAVCNAGLCCESADAVCGRSCCGGAEVCFAGACVVPGEVCRSASDCGPGRVCERSLGETSEPPEPPEGRVCLAPAATGRCIDLPPTCDTPGADLETCIRTECEYRPEVGPLDAVVQWQWGQDGGDEFPNFSDVWSTPTVGRIYDTNCDGRIDEQDPPAIVFVAGHLDQRVQCAAGVYTNRPCQRGVLRALDGATGAELWSLRRPRDGVRGFAASSVALGDVTGDGRLDIVVATGEGRVAIVDGDGNLVVESAEPIAGWDTNNFGWGGGLALGDVDGDGHPEIGFGDQIFTTRDAAGDLVLTRYVGGAGGRSINRATSFFVDLNGNGRQELLAGRIAYAFDGAAMTPLWNRTDLPANAFPAVADFDGDGLPEVALVGDGRLWVLEGATGLTELGPVNIPGGGSGGPPTVADFTGDGRREIGVATQQLYSTFAPDYAGDTITIRWSAPAHDFSSSVTGSTVFDFEGDGIAEVIYADECFLWVYDGPTGDVRFTGFTTSFTGTEASVVADVDGDGRAEIVLVSNGVNTTQWNCSARMGGDAWPRWDPPGGVDGDRREGYRGITVFRDAANAWVGTRNLWNQHAYHVTNVCSDRDNACDPARPYGAIPTSPRDNWGVSWLNNFRQNVQESGLFDAPDATLALSAACEDPILLTAVLRNRGSAILPPGVRVGFFLRDGGADVALGEVASADPLFPGQAVELTFAVPAGEGGASDTYAAEVLVDPAARTFRECDEDNNRSNEAMPACIL